MKLESMPVTFKGETLVAFFGKMYSNRRRAIELVDSMGLPYAKATVNIPEAELEDDEVLIKNWSENEGISEMLQSEGITEDTGKRVPTGGHGCEAEIHKFLLG